MKLKSINVRILPLPWCCFRPSLSLRSTTLPGQCGLLNRFLCIPVLKSWYINLTAETMGAVSRPRNVTRVCSTHPQTPTNQTGDAIIVLYERSHSTQLLYSEYGCFLVEITATVDRICNSQSVSLYAHSCTCRIKCHSRQNLQLSKCVAWCTKWRAEWMVC